jgi:hypothetical protein
MKRKKYNEGSSVKVQKSFTNINSLNANISSGVSGRKGNLNSNTSFNISSPTNKWSATVNSSTPLGGGGVTQNSYSGVYRPNKNTEFKLNKSKNNTSLTYTKKF